MIKQGPQYREPPGLGVPRLRRNSGKRNGGKRNGGKRNGGKRMGLLTDRIGQRVRTHAILYTA